MNAGLYKAPQIVTTGGWFPQQLYQYTPTDKGKLAIKNGKLCFAQGVVLDKVTYGEVQQVQKKSYAIADYTYHFLNADEWIKSPESKAFAADVFAQETMTGKLVVERADKEWTISAIPADSLAELIEGQKTRMQSNASNSIGFLDGLSKLFSGFGNNLLIGKWRSSTSGEEIEFTANEQISSYEGKRDVMRYRPNSDGKWIDVEYDKTHSKSYMILDRDRITAPNMASILTGRGNETFTRITN